MENDRFSDKLVEIYCNLGQINAFAILTSSSLHPQQLSVFMCCKFRALDFFRANSSVRADILYAPPNL